MNMTRCKALLASCLTTNAALQAAPRGHVASLRRSSAGDELSIDALEALEATLRNEPVGTGRECARYRWTQDATCVTVEVPLPFRPPQNDVALVVGETSFDVSVVNAGLAIRGALGGAANPARCGWDLFSEGDGITIRVAKRGRERWPAFLAGEGAAPTVVYNGVCEVTGATFAQSADEVNVEVALPEGVAAREVTVTITRGAWRVAAGAWAVGGDLCGAVRADDAPWVVDNGTLYLTLTKGSAELWPGLTR